MSLAGRPSVRVDHVRGWTLKPNPNFPAEHGDIRAACHDGSPFLTIACSCGAEMHLHETQITGMQPRDELMTACKSAGCGKPMLLGGKFLLDAFEDVKRLNRSTR